MHVAAVGAGGIEHPLVLQPGDDVLDLAGTVLVIALFPGEDVEPGGDHHGAELLLDDLFLLLVVDGVGGADPLAHPALALGEPAAVVDLDGSPLGHRLRERDVDGLGRLQPHVELVGGFGRAFLHADLAADALGPVDHGGLLADVHGEVAHVALDLVHLAVGHELDVLVLGAVDHARREDARGAVDSGESLVELGHVPTDGGLLLDDGRP